MKYTKWLLILVLMLGVAGCDTNSQQRIAYLQTAVEQGQVVSEHLGSQMDRLETAVTELKAQLSDPNLDPNMVVTLQGLIAKGQTVMEKVKAEKVRADAQIATWKTAIDQAVADGNSVNIGTEIGLWGSGVGAVAPMLPPPFGAYAMLASVIIGAIGSAIAKNRMDKPKIEKAKETETLLNEVINGVNAFKVLADDESKATLKAALNSQISKDNSIKINAIADA